MKQELQNMLADCTQELNDIETRINSLSAMDKGRQYFTNYALIKASGTVELVYRSIVADHFTQLASSRIDTYLDSTIRHGQNSAKYENMKNILQKFDDQWSTNFKQAVTSRVDGQRLIAASNSLVTNRHNFAHGRMPTATFLEIKQYYTDIVQLVEIFDAVVC